MKFCNGLFFIKDTTLQYAIIAISNINKTETTNSDIGMYAVFVGINSESFKCKILNASLLFLFETWKQIKEMIQLLPSANS